MDRLDYLEVREIDYVTHFDELSISTGVEIFNPIPIQPPSSSAFFVAAGNPSPDPQSPPSLASNSPAHLLRDRLPFRRGSMEKVQGLSANELGDDGVHVRRDQERLWEAWVLAAGRERERTQRAWNGRENGRNGFGSH